MGLASSLTTPTGNEDLICAAIDGINIAITNLQTRATTDENASLEKAPGSTTLTPAFVGAAAPNLDTSGIAANAYNFTVGENNYKFKYNYVYPPATGGVQTAPITAAAAVSNTGLLAALVAMGSGQIILVA